MDESLSSFLCQESEACLDDRGLVEEDDEFGDLSDRNDGSGDCSLHDEEYLQMLFDRETRSGSKRDEALDPGKWITSARFNALSWILKTREVFGFRFQTAYLAMTYFDRFLSRRCIDSEKSWAITLLSVACLSLAAKMEELCAPPLSEYETEDYYFQSKVIQRMELLVLNTLEWRMGSITPFAYLHHFAASLHKEPSQSAVASQSVNLILGIMKEINLADHRPSSIAAAATLAALDDSLTRNALECKISRNCSFHQSLDIDAVFSCYGQMRRLDKEMLQMAKSSYWPELTVSHLRPLDFSEISSVTCAMSTKRRKPPSNDQDQAPVARADKRRC
ncbi:LOW QUALITY PROTEIN: cyclin-D5-1-like [Rhodamnia argentea]|uniref:LOW QUALITY PROTEIN: cyclin-D5-1-like n=1 Tax=Rhodamnia argentea TaxID=178133 RepID=A0A8B8PUD5_9MYRT|nr:LOW QUALITY PROTEIN: cyclin-D5-1-like [Rhodamnia argentea]